VIATPFQDRWAIDIPSQIEQQVAITNTGRKKRVEVFASYTILFVGNASLEQVGNARTVVTEVDYMYGGWIKLEIANHQWQRALRNRTTAQH
jgi:hypothetical protein